MSRRGEQTEPVRRGAFGPSSRGMASFPVSLEMTSDLLDCELTCPTDDSEGLYYRLRFPK